MSEAEPSSTLDNPATKTAAVPGSPQNPLHKVATVPNLITLMRLVLTVFFVALYPTDGMRTLAVAFFVVAACTDWLDGQVARRFNQVSVFGKRFDPVMDRVLIFSGVLGLYLNGQIPTWMFVYLILRDVYLFFGGAVLKIRRGSFPDVCYTGKAATFILLTGFAFLLFDIAPLQAPMLVDATWLVGFNGGATGLGIYLVYLGLCFSVSAAVIYTKRGIGILRG